MDAVYDRLLQFTLFQGMSHADLMQVAGHTKFGFQKIAAGKRIVKADDVCSQIIFLSSGTITAESQSDDHSCLVSETISAPYTLQPERIFGFEQRYTTTFRADTLCRIITIDKTEVQLLLETQLVFRLNMLSMLAAEAQRLRHAAWRSAPDSLRQRIIRFFFSRCLYPAGHKTFRILMTQLALELNDSRLDISRALNAMQSDGLLTLHRGRIDIPLLERLLM